MTAVSPHPASNLFPLMDGADLAGLVDDIREHGLLEPIVLLDGLVLDGRNRLRACELAGVVPSFVEWNSKGLTAIEWVVSMNLRRRHLTTAQRAALALDLLPHLEADAKLRKIQAVGKPQGVKSHRPETDEETGRADEKAAELVGVGRSTVANAKAIQKRDESGDVVDRMRAGELNVAQAAREVGFAKLGQGAGTVLDDGDRNAAGRVKSVYYGKGDKFVEATEPLLRYLRAWASRDYAFQHVNPKEARRRLQALNELAEGLNAVAADLESRSQTAKLHV